MDDEKKEKLKSPIFYFFVSLTLVLLLWKQLESQGWLFSVPDWIFYALLWTWLSVITIHIIFFMLGTLLLLFALWRNRKMKKETDADLRLKI